MKSFYILLLLLLVVSITKAQDTTRTQADTTATVQGKLIDTTTRQQINRASLSLVNTRDSSKIVRGLTDSSGAFSITSVPPGSYVLRIGFQGYDNITRGFTVRPDSPLVNLGNIYMDLQSNNLLDVVVTASPRPIVIRKDTVEFNAGNFTVKPNGTVEDLLNKIPGMETDKQGNVKAQGEQVQRVLIDGKRFFGDDPALATRNLPPDVVDKIQVFDGLSDQSEFSGFDDGQRVKTINIITKKDKRKGYFGKATVAAGNKGLYENSLSVNHFNGNQQITIIGQGNNTNKQSFSMQDFLGTGNNGGAGGRGGNQGGGGNRGGGAQAGGNRGGGGAQGARGGQGGGASFSQGSLGGTNNNGLVTTWVGGLNYRDVWGPKTDVSGSYFYNNLKTNREQKSTTQQLLSGDSSLFSDQLQNSLNRNDNHRINFNFETEFDSSNSLRIRPNVSFQHTNFNSIQQTNTTREGGTPVSTSNSTRSRDTRGVNGSADVTFRHRFAKKGRTASFGLNMGLNTNDAFGNNLSVNNSYNEAGTNFTTDTINQRYDQTSERKNFSGTISYTEPVTKTSQLEINYNYTQNNNNSDRQTYNYDSASKNYNALDTALTNVFENKYLSNRITLNYQIRQAKWNITFGTGVQFAEQNSLNKTRNIETNQKYTNLYPTANFTYQFTTTKNLRLFYSGRTNPPDVQQLQPVTDYSDPLNITRGNPDLRQEFSNSIRLLYNSFNQKTQKSFFASVNGTFTNNKISNFITTVLPGTTLPSDIPENTPAGAEIITPINLNGFYNISAFLNFGFPIKTPKSNLNFGTSFNHSQTVNVQNNTKNLAAVKNYNRNYTFGQTVRYTTNLKQGFDMNFSSTSTYTMARYTINPDQNTNFFSEFLTLDATGYTKTGWTLSSEFNYTYNTGRLTGFNTSVPLWNAYIAKLLFKEKQGEIRFSVFDILNQNISIQRNVSENYIQDVQTKVLTRYFLLSFTYNLRNFTAPTPANNQNRDGMPGGGRMRM
jgi:hypothetical protein